MAASSVQANPRIKFGPFEIDSERGELSKSGVPVRIQQQPFQVLLLLVRNRGELVTREYLKQALWPTETFGAFDDGLNTAIRKIRQALGESTEAPTYLETIPRRGYRFIAPLDEPAPAVPKRHLPSATLLLVAFATTALVLTAVWLLADGSSTPNSQPSVFPLTTYPGHEGSPSFSPDGNQVAFWWDGGKPGAGGLYAKVIGTDPPVLLARSGGPNYVAWSPDGRFIAFWGEDVPNTTWALFVVPAIGGAPRKVASIPAHDDAEAGRTVAWDSTGKWLVFPDRNAKMQPCALSAVSLDGAVKRSLTKPPPRGTGDHAPAFSPDGRALVFVRTLDNGVSLELVEVTNDLYPIGEPRALSPAVNDPAWTPDGRSVVFTGGDYQNPSLYRVRLNPHGWRAGNPERLVFSGEGASQPAISSQGRLAFVRSPFTDADIWRLELRPDGRSNGNPPTRLISSTRLEHVPAYSPDSRRIAFVSNRSGTHEIWICNGDGSGAVQLTFFGGSQIVDDPRWTLDGRSITFHTNTGGRDAWFTISADGGHPRRLSENEEPQVMSPDRRWAYFSSVRSGTVQIWKRPAAGGDAVQLTRNGGDGPVLSKGGDFVYYLKTAAGFEESELWRVPSSGGEEKLVINGVSCFNFAISDRGAYFVSSGDRPSVRYLNYATRKVELLANINDNHGCGMSLSSDEHYLLFTQIEPEPRNAANLMLAENVRW